MLLVSSLTEYDVAKTKTKPLIIKYHFKKYVAKITPNSRSPYRASTISSDTGKTTTQIAQPISTLKLKK